MCFETRLSANQPPYSALSLVREFNFEWRWNGLILSHALQTFELNERPIDRSIQMRFKVDQTVKSFELFKCTKMDRLGNLFALRQENTAQPGCTRQGSCRRKSSNKRSRNT